MPIAAQTTETSSNSATSPLLPLDLGTQLGRWARKLTGQARPEDHGLVSIPVFPWQREYNCMPTEAWWDAKHEEQKFKLAHALTQDQIDQLTREYRSSLPSLSPQILSSLRKYTDLDYHPELSHTFPDIPNIFSFVAPYDASWMCGFNCEAYALFCCRRENPNKFVCSRNLGVLLAQGYQLVKEPGDMDLVCYLNIRKYGSLLGSPSQHIGHFGIYRNGEVISKNFHSNVARHCVNAYAADDIVFLRKPFNPSTPMPDMGLFTDWVDTGSAVLRFRNARMRYR